MSISPCNNNELSFGIIAFCVLYFTGRLSEVELFRPNHQGKSGFAQGSIWLIGFAIVCPVFLLTQRRHGFTFTGKNIAVQKNGEFIWEKKCAAWRWRISGKKDIVGLECSTIKARRFWCAWGESHSGAKSLLTRLSKH